MIPTNLKHLCILGELIQDFQIQLKVTENCPIVGLKAFVPGIGHVTPIPLGNKEAKVHVQMNFVEQVWTSNYYN